MLRRVVNHVRCVDCPFHEGFCAANAGEEPLLASQCTKPDCDNWDTDGVNIPFYIPDKDLPGYTEEIPAVTVPTAPEPKRNWDIAWSTIKGLTFLCAIGAICLFKAVVGLGEHP